MAKPKGKSMPIESEQNWKAQNDARTLAEAAAIKTDKARMKPAIKEATKMAASKMAEAKELKRLGNRPMF